MSSLKSLWAFLRIMWRTVFGQLTLDSALQIVKEVGSPVADALTEKARVKAAKLELEYPGTNNGEKKKAELFSYLADVASVMGVSLAASSLNLIIETVVSALKQLGAQGVAEVAAEELV